MLPSLARAFIAGLLLGSQVPYFPLSVSVALFVVFRPIRSMVSKPFGRMRMEASG